MLATVNTSLSRVNVSAPPFSAAFACMHARAHNESTALHPTFTPMFIAFLLFERSIQVQVASAGSAATALLSGTLCRVTLNQAAYSAGTKKIVSSVAIV